MALLALLATWRSAVRQSICESSVAAGFARIMCADLSAWCGLRSRTSDGAPWYLIADEVDRWIPGCFTDFLARGRSAGLRCIAIGQTPASFAERLGPK